MLLLLCATIVSAMTLSACGGNDNPPQSSPPPSGGGDTISGRERVGWTQTIENAGDSALYRYALYVDGTRRVLEGETCAPTSSASTFDCSAPLPPLAAGSHMLELASFLTQGENVYESPRSSALRVTVAGVIAAVDPGQMQGGLLISSDGLQLQADILIRDLDDPVDLAVSSEGQIFVAERAGRVRVIDPRAPEAASGRDDFLRLPAETGEPQLASIALAPDFPRTRTALVAYQTTDRDAHVFRLARFRESGGVLGQSAVIASQPVPAEASVVARFGPDRALYIGIGTGSNPGDAQNLASASGKILRLREDGTTPDDNPTSSPVFSAGHRDPRGLVWHPVDGALWEVERDEAGDELNLIRGGANYGWPLARDARPATRLTSAAMTLPEGTEPSGVAVVGVPASPLFGDLIVSALGGQDVLRIRVGSAQRGPGGRLLQGHFGRIAQVAAGSDGALYLITANKQVWGDGRDMLIRLTVGER
jgi:glucose/arabinose dehydrogenase